MSLPKNKQDFADWILRRLGAPLVNVEITNEQLEDVIDESIQMFYEWHYEGAQRSYRSIKITEEMLLGNNRRHQEINAPMYDIFIDADYRVGDRAMTYDQNENPNEIWIKYDSEQLLYQYNYYEDPNGIYYHPSLKSDREFFITWDAAKYLDSDFDVLDPILGLYLPKANVISDSDGGYTFYDSEIHNIFVYDVDSDNGQFVDSDNGFVLYDSEFHSNVVYESNPLGEWVDSDGDHVLYDSDIHKSFIYVLDIIGDWTDSDLEFRLYDSENTFVGQQRFSRYTEQKERFIRYSVQQQRYKRHSAVNGLKFNRNVVKEYERTYQWNEIWKSETKILNQPILDLDYSKEGQVGIPIPENIYGIIKVFKVNSMSSMGMWNYEYQMFMNNFDWFYGAGGSSPGALTNYYTAKTNLEFIDFMLNTQPAIRFNKHKNKLYIDTSWINLNRQKEFYLLAEVYEVLDPDVYGDIYSDKWLKRYATSLAKVQWGSNLKKYTNVSLPGGTMLDGQALYDEGMVESHDLLTEIKEISSSFIDSIIIG